MPFEQTRVQFVERDIDPEPLSRGQHGFHPLALTRDRCPPQGESADQLSGSDSPGMILL